MKVRLAVGKARYEEIKQALAAHGIETDDSAELVLSESGRFLDTLTVKDRAANERVLLPVEEITYIETYGHSVEVHTGDGTYQAAERLYKLAALLDPDKFLRVSNSVVIARDKVRRITPTLSMKFILTMADGGRVDVTRSYYYIFKESFGI
ncbi:MAG: LytTR family DNA-binding domain-containing protein [Oscillospiraceae bacterium]